MYTKGDHKQQLAAPLSLQELEESRKEQGIAALNALKKGVKLSYRYGFKEAHLTPVKSWAMSFTSGALSGHGYMACSAAHRLTCSRHTSLIWR
jgi:hypothetical protein